MTDDIHALDWLERPVGSFATALEEYLQHLRLDYLKWKPANNASRIEKKVAIQMSKNFCDKLHYTKGTKYYKVVTVQGDSRSVQSFIDFEGKIWKAEGWSRPATNFPRGDIFKPESYARHTWTGA